MLAIPGNKILAEDHAPHATAASDAKRDLTSGCEALQGERLPDTTRSLWHELLMRDLSSWPTCRPNCKCHLTAVWRAEFPQNLVLISDLKCGCRCRDGTDACTGRQRWVRRHDRVFSRTRRSRSARSGRCLDRHRALFDLFRYARG